MALAALRDRSRATPMPGMAQYSGLMSPRLDALSLQFVIWAGQCDRLSLDLGCGDGIATAAVLDRGAHVVAMDPDPACIERLLARVPREQHPRVTTRVAGLPTVDFMTTPFSAVHAARVLNLLDGAAIRHSVRKFFRWLYPDGKLFLSVLTPHGAAWKPLRKEFVRRQAAGVPWPGYFSTGVEAIHLLDERTLRRELESAGFAIEEAGSYALPWDRDQMCCSLVATCRR